MMAGGGAAVVSFLRKLSRAKRDRASEEKGLVVTQSPFLAMSELSHYAADAIERGEHRAALAQGEEA